MTVLEKEKIFNDLYKKRITYIQGFCRRYANHHEAEEVAHDIFLNVYRFLDDFKNDSSLDTWLFSITKNRCYNYIRFKNTNLRKAIVFSLDASLSDIFVENNNSSLSSFSQCLWDKKSNFVDNISNKQILDIVKYEMKNLTKKEKECINCYIENDCASYEELSKILNISIAAVRARLFKARVALKYNMKKYGPII